MTPPHLVIIRGNSGSGKSTVAREVQRRYGRGCALIEQDHLRRILLREHDCGEPVAPRFIADSVRSALGLGYHVVLEGILHSGRYAGVLRGLIAGHDGPSHVFYLDVPLDETLRRHRDGAHRTGFTEDDMRGWYSPGDLLGVEGEVVIGAASAAEETVTSVLRVSGLGAARPLTPCPVTCPRCAVIGGPGPG